MPLVIENITESQGIGGARCETVPTLRTILDTVPVGISYLNNKEQFQFANQRYEYLLGIKADSLIGTNLKQALGKKPYKVAGKFAKRALKGETVSHENVLRPRTGGEISVLVSYVPDVGPDDVVRGFYALVEDISEHKRLEAEVNKRTSEMHEALNALELEAAESKQFEDQYKTLLHTAPDPIIQVDLEGKILEINKEAERVFGYRRAELLGQDLEIFVPKGLRKSHRRQRREYLKSPIVRPMAALSNLTAHCKDGRELPVEISLNPTRISGTPVIIASVRDVTKRRLLEENLKNHAQELEKSEALLNEAQRIAKIGSWEWNIETNESWWSDEVHRIFGTERQSFEANYEAFLERVHPDDRKLVGDSIQRAIDKYEEHSIDHRIIMMDGMEKIVHEQAEVTFDAVGRPIRMTGTVQDITERKSLETALEVSERRARRLLESTPAIPWEADIQTWSFSYVGPKAVALLGFPRERWLEKDFWANHLHPDDKTWVIEYCRESSEQLDNYEFEYRMIAKDGRTVWLQDIVNVAKENGKPIGLRGFMIDITDRKRSERVLRDLTARVIAAQEDEQKRIARELHDDLSQELALIAVQLDLLGKDLPKNQNAIKRKLADVQDMAMEASSAVHKISHQLHPAMLDQLGLVAAMGAYCNEVSARQGPQIEFNNLTKLDHVPADISLSFYRVLQESIQNALKHSGSDTIRVKLFSKGDEVYLTVQDEGCGFHVDPNADYGLGLTSMAERMELGGGVFEISSEPGKGTKVTARQTLKREA
ncbi:MAG: PAS domain S-box protein [Proteobacteria bacterium]|nr:PAS domain S-box protein [Pseudomonadota bacterium]